MNGHMLFFFLAKLAALKWCN